MVSANARIYAAIAAGSATGAVARFAVSWLSITLFGAGFPWGTLAVNIGGSALIGLYATLTDPDGRLLVGPAQRQFVLAGFCGGFTTFSIFSLETLIMVDSGRITLAALYVVASILSWLIAVWCGHRIGKRLNALR